MATRRQKQLERKYSSFKRYTATEDVNYSTHSSRSSYRSESVTSRSSARGRSSSTEVSTGSETRSFPVFIAIQDYTPESSDVEAIPLEQGQIVEVLDNKNAASWLVRTKARPPRTGWVPGSYFETPTEFYKQRRRTRDLASTNLKMTEEQEAIMKRDQVYHDLLRTEEDFVTDLNAAIDFYVQSFDDPGVPAVVRDKKSELVLNLRELYNFHANVMLKGLQYYSDDPGKVGQTFVRLEPDFEHHVHFYRESPKALKLIEENAEIKEFLQGLSDKVEAGAHGYSDYLKQIGDRVKQYADFFKEIIKYSARASTSTKSMQKALELVQSIPKRAEDVVFTENIKDYPGDNARLGRLFRHDLFQVWEDDQPPVERYVFLFKNKVIFTERDNKPQPPIYKHCSTIRLDKYTVRVHTADEDTLVLRPNEPGFASYRIRAKDLASLEYVRKAWLKDMTEMQEAYCPEEGPPRKKIKSPPGISPTGSSTSLYSGGSSIDWTTTGTTLEMQGTRVTRTQYGFRTLQESSAKMCLKVTGYPLPEITWYKEDELLKEDERRTFYADEDGFFAMTIDPVQVTDTGRYTCVATNEYGQASTSAFFRVLKVEKEAAPPAFVGSLADQTVKEGEVVSFECEVEGWPEPELVWMVDDQPLRPSHDFRLQYDGQNARLEIRDAQPEDTGTYAVKITNEYGSKESTAHLVVQPDPDKNHVPPEFQAVIEDAECNEGDTVRFKAVLTGDPDPEVTWIINGIPLTESEKVKFINEDGICILTIRDVSRHFDGLVTCQGKNRLGTSACEAHLRVRVPPAAPAFDRPLEDRVITEKSAVMFECDVSGYPDPKLQFTLKGQPLAHGVDGVEIVQQENHYRITVNNASADKHEGDIVAKAQNEHGQAESRAKLTVEPEEEESRSAPTFVKDIEDQTIKEGESASFQTTVRGNPNPVVSWFLNGHKLDSTSPGVKIEASGADHKLTIVDSTKYAGTVLARAENSIGRFETKARLIVLPAEKKRKAPEFLERLQDVAETEGSTAVFEARVDAEPRAQFKWILNGEELVENNRVHFREFDGSVKLEIADIKLDEAGTLKCIAFNGEGEVASEAKFAVNRKACRPVIQEKPKSANVERGQPAVFTAKVDGVPFPEVTWAIAGRKIRPTSDGAKIETTPDGRSTLTVDTNMFFETGTITLTVENAQGTDETGCLMTVEEPKPKDEKLVLERGMTDQVVERGGLAHFETVIRHARQMEWFVNGQPVHAGQEGVTVSQDENFEFRLTLDTSKFGGTVAFKASNAVDSMERRALLTVTEKARETNAPAFTDQLKDVQAELGKPLDVDVIALNEPVFQWTLNGQPMEDGRDGVHISKDGNKTTLHIDEIKPQHAGTLAVQAENEAGKSTSTAQIAVVPAAVGAKIAQAPKSVSVQEKETAEFCVVVQGSPTPQVQWLLNERILDSSVDANVAIDQPADDTFKLRLHQVTPNEAGKLTVKVHNASGSDSSTVDLTVQAPEAKPTFKTTLTDAKVEEGSPLTFNVALDAPGPGMKVTWFLNNKKLESADGVKIADNGDGTHQLQIDAATPDMNGTLTVRAENTQGTAESKARVEVSTGERKPEFSKSPQDHDTEEEVSVKFSAIVTGVPDPEVTWFLNDSPIVSGDEIRVKHEKETGKTSIRIFKPAQEHTGRVKVKAQNKHGAVEATAELKVSKKKEIPRFITELSDRQVNENTDVKFSARIAAFPELIDVQWTLNGKPITASNAKTTVSGDQYTIEFTKVQLDQAGELAVEARNEIGTKKENCTLAIKEMGIAPNFTTNLSDRLVEEGQTMVMEAQMNKDVKPSAEISWFRDGKPLTDPRFRTSYDESTGTLKLAITSAEMTDKCRVSVKAENRWGVAECTASIGVQKRKSDTKPQFLSDLAPITITEGDSLQTKVIISGDPKPSCKWYICGQLVCQTEDTELKEDKGVYSLTIHGCTTDMTGPIKVVASNRMGDATLTGQLSVIAPIPVEFETCLCDATCREGDTLKLKAVLLGEPMPTVSWYVNGKKLEESQNIKIHAEKGTYTVTIKDITMDYSGKVVCEAVNEFGKASSEATLLVLPRGEPPDFIEWLSNIRARQGSSVTHKVVFTGDPKPVLTWYINNKEVQDGVDGISIKTTHNTSTLSIKNFVPEKHVGEIICKAENDAGEVSCTANMITYTSDMFSESESEAMAEDVGLTDDLTEVGSDAESVREEVTRTPTPVMAPKFITKIKDTKAHRGHQAVFECVVPDTKGVCCKWLKDGKEIELIARIRVQMRTIEGHVTNELIIDDVKPEDAGRYTCIVENTAGQEQCEASLTVAEDIRKPAQRAPEFTVQLKDKQVRTSERITFECKVAGEPLPTVSWYCGDQKLVEESKKIIIESDEGVQRLVIENAQPKDSGLYSCVAENAAGTSKTEAKLEVRALEAPEFTRTLTDQIVSLGEQITLECSVRGVPQPVVDFFSLLPTGEKVQLQTGGRVAVQQDATATHWRMVVRGAEEADLHEYVAEARNDAGTVSSKAVVSSKSPKRLEPEEPGKKSQKLKEGETAEMAVEVTGHKPVEGEQPQEEPSKPTEEAPKPEEEQPKAPEAPKAPEPSPAKFLEGLRNIDANENDTVELIVRVGGYPLPQVSWEKNGQPVAMDGEHLIVKRKEDGVFALTLNRLRLDDGAKYTAKAVNKSGKDETAGQLTIVEEVNPPLILEKMKDVEIKEDQTVEVCTTATGKPSPTIEWFRNGQPIAIDGTRVVQRLEGNHHTLLMHKATLEEAGQYMVRACNKAGTAESSCTVKVLEDLEAPKFTDTLHSREIKEGQFSELSVSVSGKPLPEIKWFKDGVAIVPDGSHILEKSAPDYGVYSISIRNAVVDDSGTYSCTAVNKAGRDETSAKFKVAEDLERPAVTDGLVSRKLKEGAKVEMSVTVSGKPKPSVTFCKDGEPVPIDGERVQVVVEGATHTLIIHDARLSDSGNYTAKVQNKVGTVESKADLTVVEDLEHPAFVGKLRNLELTETDCKELSIVVTGKPTPQVEWFKDGKPLAVDGTRLQVKSDAEGRHTFLINGATFDDIGEYKIKASNKVGTVETKASVYVVEFTEAPRFTEKLKDVQINEEETAIFDCTIVGRPTPDVNWFRDGRPVFIDNKRIFEHVEASGRHVLRIEQARKEDVGTYSCQAVNKVGASSSKADLRLVGVRKTPEPPREPTFLDALQSQTVKEGETAVFECHVDETTKPEVAWFRDGKPVTASDRIQIEHRPDGTCKLMIKNAKPEDVGTYKVEAANPAGKASSEAPLKYAKEEAVPEVSLLDESDQVKPVFVHPLKQQAVKEGDTVTFECKVNEASHPEIQWFRNDEPVDVKPNLLIEHRPDGTLRLKIRNVRAEDIGTYRCEAVNRAGKAQTQAPLKYAQMIDFGSMDEEEAGLLDEEVQQEPETVKVIQDKSTAATERIAHTHAEYVMITDDIEPSDKRGAGAPEFVELLRSALTCAGSDAVLRCKVKGEPRPTIQWTRQGKAVELSSRVTSDYGDDGVIVLTIRNATDADVGEYRCEASNDFGSAWTEAPVILAAAGSLPTDGEAPDFLQPVRPVTVQQGATAVLEGKIIGKPEPAVRWLKGGVEISKTDSRYQIESLADGTQRLTLQDAKFEDIGEFRCEATNKWGDVWSDATLTVHAASVVEGPHEGQIVPTFTRTLQETTAKENEHIEFDVMVGGTPTPEVKWFKDNKPIAPTDQHFKQTVDADGKAKLVIDQASKEDAGKYTCEATNAAGTAKSEAPLTVTVAEEPEKAPAFAQNLKAVQAQEGETVTFESAVDGNPKPAVKWFKDGSELKADDRHQIEATTEGLQKLTIQEAKVEDQGNYRVEATNELGSASSKAPLTVEPAEKLNIKRGLQDQQVPAGSKLQLGVEVEGKPKTVKWFKGNEELRESATTQIEKVTEEEYRLAVEKAALTDTGAYRVVLSSDVASVESSCHVTVTDVGAATGVPAFKKGLANQKVPKGAPLRLEVEVDGKPKSVKFYRNGDEIKPDGRKAKLEDLGDGKYALVIPETDENDSGEYKVVATNDAGDAESKATVSVQEPKPKIVSGLKPVAVKPGERAVLEVEVEGPVKQVKWYKNGKELTDAQTEELNGKKFRLIIPNAAAGDAGDYRVLLSNDAGDADSSAPVSVEGEKEPVGKPSAAAIKFVKPLQDVTADKGATVPLEIELDRKPKSVKWYKNGKEILPGDKEQPKQLSDTKYRLEVPDVDADGEFKVVAVNDDDVPSDSACALTVRLPAEPPKPEAEAEAVGEVEAPKFVKGLADTTIPVGDTLDLPVQTSGFPRTVKFYKNGQLLPGTAGDRIQVTKNDDNNYILSIPKALVDDSGDYAVEIENEAGKAKSEAKIAVEPKLTFLKPLKDVDVVEGEAAEFTVETNAHPRSVKWYRNGQEIKPGDAHFVVQTVDDTKFKLTIPTANKDDAGTFKVVLENAAGPVDSSAALTVKSVKKPPPKIVKGLEDQVVARGNALIFEVKVDGDVADVRWLKDGQPVEKANASAKIEKVDGNTYRLTIPKAELSDAGQIDFQASNDGGKATSTAKAEVDEKPEIVKALVPADIEEGDDQVFKVEVSAPVRQVKWYRNGQEIKPSAHAQPKQVSPKKFELLINKAHLDDGATYKVVLTNAAGECDSSAPLTVAKPNVLKLVQGLSDVDVDEGQPLQLSCKIDGVPKTVKWFKNGKEVVPDERVKIVSNPETGEYSLAIDSSVPSDGAAYRVVFANEKGDLQTGAVAHVKAGKKKEAEAKPATFLSPLQDTNVEEGDILTLKCRVSGEPQPTLQWYRNGELLKPSDRVAMRVALDGTATLRIMDSKKSDAGDYKVVATNAAGSVDSACKVGVLTEAEMPAAPKFVVPLRASEAPLGAKAEFNVKVRGVPKPVLRFQIDGRNIPIDGERISLEDMHDGNFCLTIKEVKEEDFGVWRCVAENEHGQDECEAKFGPLGGRLPRPRDEEGYPPRFNVPLWDRRVPLGDPMFIECHVDAKPLAEITWTFNGDELKQAQGIQIEYTPEGACRVKIAEFCEHHVGVYKCFAKNEYGTADTIANLNVEVHEEAEELKKIEYAPRFAPGLEDQLLREGDSLSLRCRVDAVPTANITWYKDGLPVRNDDRLKWAYDPTTGECTLSVKDVRDGDEGAYRCVASNHLGSTNTACLVTVKTEKKEAPKLGAEPAFTKGLVDKYVDRGETLTFECAVTGDPMPEVKWYRNGILLRPSPRIQIENAPDGTCKLVVKEASMSDEGIYRCEAENSNGRAKTQCTAHVQMAIKREKTPVVEGEFPKFVIPLEDSSVRVNGTIELECKVTGVPMPMLKWSKDGGPMIEDSRFVWDNQPEKGLYRLTIKKATVHDEGTYRAVASNESGSATSKAMIRIDDGGISVKPTPSTAPRIAVRLADVRITEGQPLRLECKIDGTPDFELTWYKDGEKVHPSDRLQLERTPEGHARLIIPKATMDDDGLYRVIAANAAGSAVDKCTATVRRAPRGAEDRLRDLSPAISERFDANKAPRVIVPLENVRVPEKQSFKLSCKFAGDPKPGIKWFKDGERVYSHSRVQLTESADGTCELVVESASRMDAGMYRCVAENDFGSARTTCEVTVQLRDRARPNIDDQLREGKAPGFSIPLTLKRARVGETVVFECLPYGKPFPAIKWLKDGIELVPGKGITIEALPDGTQKLTVEDVESFSEGYYRCVATNEHGTASTKAELTVTGERRPLTNGLATENGTGGLPEESRPRIRRGLYPMSIHRGNTAEMQVCATGWPTPTVKWFKDGQELRSEGPEGRRTLWTDDRGIHHCVILNVQPEDEGDYSLIATNPLGEAKTEGPLSVIRPRHEIENGEHDGMPFPPGFIRQLKNKHVFNKMPTIFDCLVVGHPAPTVDWYHNGQKIVPDSRRKIQVAGGGSHALIIFDTTLEDAGEYLAIARNSHGTAQSSALLDVTVPHLDNIKFDGSIDVTPYLTEEYGFKKLNYKCLPTPPDRGPFIKEVTGHYLTLSWIPTKRTPPRYPQVTYVIEIRELPDRDWTLLDYNIPEPVCKVRNLELGRSYQFRVRAENIYGISDPSPASPPSRLMAPPRPVMDKNKRIIPLLDPYAEKALEQAYAEQFACAPWFAPGAAEKRYCAENDTIAISFNFAGYPDPKIQWKFRGWDVDTTSPTSNIRVATLSGAETVLTISGFKKENAGQYQCFASNQYGDAEQKVQIDLAERPHFLQPLEDKVCSDGKPMKLDVRVEGNSFPEIKWLKDWRPMVESHRIKFVQDGPYLCSLIITEPIWRDSGIYSVIAVNDAGQATTSCTVTVEADGEYNDVQLPRKKVGVESRKVKAIYDIAEEDEQRAATGAYFVVREKRSDNLYVAQLRPLDDSLRRGIAMHNVLDDGAFAQYHQVLADRGLALVVFENADSSLLENLLPPQRKRDDSFSAQNREEEVRVFVKQLLTALRYMHHRNIAHLDLRPEVVLLQDDRLKLADFGQSRHLLAGKAHGEIQGSPEFVAPEVALGLPVTLAADMWSAGVLTYVLLSGVSPFLGDNDEETLANVVAGRIAVDAIPDVSPEGRDFLRQLLACEPVKRLSVDQALAHDWLNDAALADAKLSIDCLREFKYKHKWLERRVFVQQTPSDQFTQLIEQPLPSVARSAAQDVPSSQAEPFAVYDYLRVKDDRQPTAVPEYDARGRPHRRTPRHSESPDPFLYDHRRTPSVDPFDPRFQHPQHQIGAFPSDSRRFPSDAAGFDAKKQPESSTFDPQKRRDPFGGRVPTSEELRELIQQNLPPGVKIPAHVRPEDLLFVLPPPSYDPRGAPGAPPPTQRHRTPDQFGPSMPQGMTQALPPTRAASSSPQTERRRLQPQEKGETPSQNGHHPPKRLPEELSEQTAPVRLVRGERRDIEDEIANRILSDISEENSIAGSVASLDDVEPLFKMLKDRKPRNGNTRKSRSRSSTPQAEGSDGTLTPLASPAPTVDSVDPMREFFGDDLPNVPEFNDPKVPVGAPVFIDGLGRGGVVTVESGPLRGRASLSPRPRSGTPGTKSPVMVSPGREHKMECVIATKRGKQGRTSPMREIAEPIRKRGDGDDDEDNDSPRRASLITHPKDQDFDNLMDEVERIKAKYRKPVDDDLEKYRPKNFYKEEDDDLHRIEEDVDDYPWESAYQIGPDTLLLASRGPEFNARVRDYRRELWGDGAPLVRQGFLGHRNQDITVRERRRFTDLVREDPKLSKEIKEINKSTEKLQNGALRKITTTSVISVPNATKKNADGTFGAIFKQRLRDVCMNEHSQQLVLTCYVVGDPAPEVVWRQHESVLTDDTHYRITREGELCRLTICRPMVTDVGEYSCTASNEHGQDKCAARVVTGDVPGRPGRPEVELSSDTEVLVTFEPPEMSTYLEGVRYKIEARPAGDNDHFVKWTPISDNVEDEAVIIKHLHPQGIYQFRVTAANGFGWGLPSVTSRIIRTHARGVPKLQTPVLQDQMKLTVLAMPHRKGRADPGLSEISEQAEEEASEEELSTDESIASHRSTTAQPLTLSTEDPKSRFQLENETFRGPVTIVRNAVDTKALVTKHVVAKLRIQSKTHPADLKLEFETLKAAQHENVVQLFAAYERVNTLALFTERLYENVFERFCYPDSYTEEQISLTMRQVAAALHWIHFKGVLHLDVQPDNVMFTSKRAWMVKLIDFEEAVFADAPEIKKRKPANPEWAAPELLTPGGVPTAQTDVWGMGMIAFTLLAGFHPFSDDGETPEEVTEAVCKQKCDPNLIPVQASQEALSFATWAIKKNPGRRMRTSDALTHRWLSSDKNLVRRREAIKYPSNRLRRTAVRTMKRPSVPTEPALVAEYGAKRR